MRFRIDDLEVFFPYERMYLEQYQYMRSIKQALDAEGHALLEMPTGTGKTVRIYTSMPLSILKIQVLTSLAILFRRYVF